jgi:hypothetical protein
MYGRVQGLFFECQGKILTEEKPNGDKEEGSEKEKALSMNLGLTEFDHLSRGETLERFLLSARVCGNKSRAGS